MGYLGRNGNNPAPGNGLFGGSYGALTQIGVKAGAHSLVGITYARTLNSDPGTGSTTANLGGLSDS